MLAEPLTMNRNPNVRQNRPPQEYDVFMLTVRAYDLGVPVMFSTTIIRIYPPESKMRTVSFVIPGKNLDRKKTEEILSTITGGRVIIHDIVPYNENEQHGGGLNGGGIDVGSDIGGQGGSNNDVRDK